MGYILDLPGGTSALDSIDYTAADYVIHAFYTADGAGNVIQVDQSNTDAYRNAGLVDKVHAKGRRIVMSLGGANHSGPLATIAKNPGLRATFINNVVAKLNEWGYDGVDLDFEFPGKPLIVTVTKQEHYAFMSELFAAVKANNANHLVMFGITTGYYITEYEWAQLGSVSDYGFYFCYDWGNPANGPMKNPGVNQSTLGGATIEGSCSGALNYMLAGGFPANKIIVGLPFYANGGAHYADAPQNVKSGTPDPNYMEVSDGAGGWWPNVASTQMKMDAVLNAPTSVLTGGATVAGVGWWEWGYENPASPDLSQAIKQKLGK
jgi:GH18 family chitinase